MEIRRAVLAGLAAAAVLAVTACTGGGGTTASPTTSATQRVYSEDELRSMISGLRDSEGHELKL